MQEFLPSLTREIRSSGNSLLVIGQDVKGMKPILPVVKSNCASIIFMCGMTGEAIDELAGEFQLDEEDRKYLSRTGKGRFYFYGNARVPGRVIPLATERKVFFGEDTLDIHGDDEYEEVLPLSGKDYSEPDYELIDPRLKYVVDTFGVLNKNWIKTQKDIEIPGFTINPKVSPATDYLSKVNYLSNDIANLDKIHGESRDHWVTKCLIGGECILVGCRDVIINTYGDQGGDEDPDVTCITPSGQRLGFEYAHPGSRSIGRLRNQKNNHLKHCDIWRCICQQKNEPEVRAAVNEEKVKGAIGEDFCIPRGAELGKFLQSFKVGIPEFDVKEELEKLRKEDEFKAKTEENHRHDESSFSEERTINTTRTGIETGEIAAVDGTLTEGMA